MVFGCQSENASRVILGKDPQVRHGFDRQDDDNYIDCQANSRAPWTRWWCSLLAKTVSKLPVIECSQTLDFPLGIDTKYVLVSLFVEELISCKRS